MPQAGLEENGKSPGNFVYADLILFIFHRITELTC